MTSSVLPVALLHQLCALLPESDAAMIRRMPTDDLMTYVEAYAAARRSGVDLPPDLRREFVQNLVDQIEEEYASERGRADA